MATEFRLSRRQALAALGTVGAASAGAGLGTSAYFSDVESFANDRLAAGELDMHAAYSAHYSDWSPDEGSGVAVRMWDGPPGTTGGESDLAPDETGLPIDAAWLVAVDDPEAFLSNTQYAADGAAGCDPGTDAADLARPVIDLDDVKPGDFGEVTFDFALCDNPGYVWLRSTLDSAAENGLTEPEADDPDEGAGVELLDAVRAAVWVDDGDDYQDGEEVPTFVGPLRRFLSRPQIPGIEFGGDMNAGAGGGTGEQGCFSAGPTHSVGVAWWVPVDHGNEIQTDSVAFSLGIYTEQCRHNAGTTVACSLDECTRAFLLDEPTDATLGLLDGPQWDGESVAGTSTVRVGAGVPYVPAGGLAPWGFDPVVTCVDADTTVTWEWVDQTEVNPTFPPGGGTITHNVILFESPGEGCDLTAVDPSSFAISSLVGYNSAAGVGEPEPFEHTFTEPGVYPYYCEPHGAPTAIADPDPSTGPNEALDDYHHPPGRPELADPQNLLGMRGAVVVVDR